MENKKLNLLSLGILLVLIPFVFALTGVIQTDTFYDSSNNPLTGVQNILYNCAGAYTNAEGEMRCTSVGSLLYSLNSGSSNQISFEYPYNPSSTSTNPDYYAQYLYKSCYLPKDYVNYIWGYGTNLNYNYNFNKAASCHSPIDSFSITNTNYANEPVVVNVQVVAEADAQSAFTDFNNGEVWYPPTFVDYYSAETKVTFSVLDSSNNVVHTESKTVNIYMDASENIEFRWTPPIQGDYTANIETEVIDCQCESNFKQSSQKIFTVWAARPQNECYTILNDLATNPQFITEDNPITISFNKISNYADNLFVKTAVPTSVNYEITQGSTLVYSGNSLIPANSNTNDYQNVELPWTPASGGDYSIRVTGVAQSSLCSGKTNPAETAILGIFVSAITQYNVQFNVRDTSGVPINQATVVFGSSTGQTDASGNLNFNVNPGTYNWQVSKTGYITQTGSLIVDGDETLSIVLSAEPVPGTFAPAINIPDQFLTENSGYHDNLINLQGYTTDADTPIGEIVYSIISQSDTLIVSCSIDVDKYLDCNVEDNIIGFSEVSILASDGSNTDSDSFNIYVGNFINGTIVRLLYPEGGENLAGNVNVSWIAINSDGHALLISLYYSLDNGTSWNMLVENETNDGSYIWDTRNYPNDRYLLRIKATDSVSGTTVYDQTISEFTVYNSVYKRLSSNKEEETACEPLLQCSGWSDCYDGIQTRTCKDINFCGDYFEETSEMRICGTTEGIILSLKDADEEGLVWKKTFLWLFPIGLVLASVGIIFALFLMRRK
ncbi:MAG: carboxypeptidase-like regulatory domain-containing protein [archaeon]